MEFVVFVLFFYVMIRHWIPIPTEGTSCFEIERREKEWHRRSTAGTMLFGCSLNRGRFGILLALITLSLWFASCCLCDTEAKPQQATNNSPGILKLV